MDHLLVCLHYQRHCHNKEYFDCDLYLGAQDSENLLLHLGP